MMSRSRRVLRASAFLKASGWALALWLAGHAKEAGGAEPAGPTEWELKAAVVCQIIKFVEWPQPLPTNAPRVIGVVGEGPLIAALERLLASAPTPSSHPLTIKKLSPSFARTNASDCQVLVFSDRVPEQTMTTIIANVPQGLLTVSDARGFARQGGMVGLRMERQRVQLEINLAACERARLRLSSRLLRQAKIVSHNVGSSP